jgi:hypothetical protein
MVDAGMRRIVARPAAGRPMKPRDDLGRRWSLGAGRCLCTVHRADHHCCVGRGGQWLALQAASRHGEHA